MGRRSARVAVVGFGGLGVLLAVALNDDHQPSLNWTKTLVCTAVGAGLLVALRLLTRGGRRDPSGCSAPH